MSKYQVSWNPDTREAKVQLDGATPGAGFTRMGDFDHPDLIYPDSLVMYQGVQKVLYRTKNSKPPVPAFFPDGITDMQRVSIVLDAAPVPVPVTGINASPNTITINEGATQQITAAVVPANADNQGITYVSDAPATATVSATGLVTGVAAGSTNITVKTVDGGFEKIIPVTVEAP